MRRNRVPLVRLGQGEYARDDNGERGGDCSALTWFAVVGCAALAVAVAVEVYENHAARGEASVSASPAAALVEGGAR